MFLITKIKLKISGGKVTHNEKEKTCEKRKSNIYLLTVTYVARSLRRNMHLMTARQKGSRNALKLRRLGKQRRRVELVAMKKVPNVRNQRNCTKESGGDLSTTLFLLTVFADMAFLGLARK